MHFGDALNTGPFRFPPSFFRTFVSPRISTFTKKPFQERFGPWVDDSFTRYRQLITLSSQFRGLPLSEPARPKVIRNTSDAAANSPITFVENSGEVLPLGPQSFSHLPPLRDPEHFSKITPAGHGLDLLFHSWKNFSAIAFSNP